MHTSWSEIDTIRHCLRKHHYRYKDRWVSTRPAGPRDLGIRWHKLMELLYTTGEADAPVKQLREWTEEEPGSDEIETLTWMLTGYYEAYGLGDPLWVAGTAFVEVKVEVELPDIGYGPLLFTGFVDLGVDLWRKLWVVDHKSGVHAAAERDLEMADQWTLYTWALREMGYDIFGSIHNYARTDKLVREMTLQERFARTPIHRSEREVQQVVFEATVDAWRGKIDNGAPRAPGEYCFRRCDFFDACVADRRYSTEMAVSIIQRDHKQDEEKLDADN